MTSPTTSRTDTTTWPPFQPGMKIRFASEKQAYTVQAVSPTGRYVVCTKPFNARRTILHTVLDLARGVRGPGTSWALGYGTPEDCKDTAAAFDAADTYAAMTTARHQIDPDDPQWLAQHPDLIDRHGQPHPRQCEISYRNWVWIRLDDRQSDTRTAALVNPIRTLVATAPARNYNDHDPRTPAELEMNQTP